MIRMLRAALVFCASALAGCGSSPPPVGVTLPPPPCDGYNALRNPYFGDLHVHTTYSLDANTQGTRLTPHDAYRYARGERLDIQPYNSQGQSLRHSQLVRQLDFTAVTDHAELFGETEICNNPDYAEYNSADCQFYRDDPENAFLVFNLAQLGTRGTPGPDGKKRVQRQSFCGADGAVCLEAAKTPWADIQNAAAAFNDRCNFTSFVAYEYTGSPESNNLHRNVIFRTDSVPVLPPAYQENPAPEFLWQALARDCRPEAGCDYLTIPHNSNLSQGLMFQAVDDDGFAYTADIARTRQLNEPLAEVHQHKGQSECLNVEGGSPDELCDFELLPYNNLTGERAGGTNNGPPLPQDFLRSALKAGLVLEEPGKLGVNPFKYGFVGGSDTHLATPGNVMESGSYPGHGGAGTAARDSVPPGISDLIENNPGGLSVIWAEQNSRDSIYAAMRRRETYATSGTRPMLRFFGGWKYPDNLCDEPQLVGEGYRLGVPMGGDLPPAPAGVGAPRFVVSALRDPLLAGETARDLQYVQIIKGWVVQGAGGPESREAVYDIAGNKNNGASVNVETCATAGTGSRALCRVWRDPDFDPQQRAFYYVRVLENPSCRWSNRQCVAAGYTASVCATDAGSVPAEYADCCNVDHQRTIQERAWSSPIWYTPSAP